MNCYYIYFTENSKFCKYYTVFFYFFLHINSDVSFIIFLTQKFLSKNTSLKKINLNIINNVKTKKFS